MYAWNVASASGQSIRTSPTSHLPLLADHSLAQEQMLSPHTPAATRTRSIWSDGAWKSRQEAAPSFRPAEDLAILSGLMMRVHCVCRLVAETLGRLDGDTDLNLEPKDHTSIAKVQQPLLQCEEADAPQIPLLVTRISISL